MSTKKGEKKAAAAVSEDPRQADIKRYTDVIQELSKKAPAKVAPYVKKFAPYLATAAVYFIAALPYVMQACQAIQKFVSALPEKIIYAALGFLVCFFGGIFPATIAAAEAWKICGGREAMEYCILLYKQAEKVHAAQVEDEKKDDDGDGVPDVKQINPKALIRRKASMVATVVDPETVSKCFVGLYTGWIGVLAILKIRFAKTVALGERIGAKAYTQVSKIEPAIMEVVPEEYRKWVPLCVRWTCKLLAIKFAWWMQSIISAFHSAIIGGLLFGTYVVDFLKDKKIIHFSSEDSYLDEVIGWSLAGLGFLFQFWLGFHLPFPLNLFLWPLQLLEGFIVWSVAA